MESYKVLFIDDTIDNLKTMVSIFGKYLSKYKTYQTNNPHKGIDIAREIIPDLIITDWEMPQLNGIELVKTLKENPLTKEIPIIMATGVMLTTKHLQQALSAGAVDYIRKPIDPTELVARTKSALLLSNYYKQIVQEKDNALTENSMFLIKNSEYFNSLAKKIEEIEERLSSDPEIVKQKLAELKEMANQHDKKETWNRFNKSFTKVHSSFHRGILDTFPNLTPTEIKLCSLIRLGMSNKEMASVLFQSTDSIKVSRYRLRKKLNLDKDTNLESFVGQF